MPAWPGDSVDLFISGLQQENGGLGQAVNGAAAAQTGSAQLRDGARQLAAGLRLERGGQQQVVSGLDMILVGMASDPIAQTNGTYAGVTQIRNAERDQLVPGLDAAIAGADRIATGNGDLATGLGQLHAGLVKAQAGIQQLQDGEKTFKAKLSLLAGGAGQVSGGVGLVASGTDQLKTGLDQAANYLNSISVQGAAAGLDTFFIPADRLSDPQLALARYFYLSSDGTTARLLVFGKDDPFGTAAMGRVGREKNAIHAALAGTPLAGAQVMAAGEAPLNANLESYFTRDFRVVAIAVLLGVFIVLVLLLRSLVAPVYLLVSVLLSYAAAMGFTTLVWQDLLGKGAIDWTVPIFAFVMLVAVGADYNIFLMSRVREEVLRDPVDGISRAVRRTGAIITSAGIIFAGTFAAMVTSPVLNIAETGFAITFGLLLDTFLVRSFVVPSVAVLLGKWNWWPHFGMRRDAVAALERTGRGEPAKAPQPEPRGSRHRPQPAR